MREAEEEVGRRGITDPAGTQGPAMATEPEGVTASEVIGDLMAIADRDDELLNDRLTATEARIGSFKGVLAELAKRHGWPQAKVDHLTSQLRLRLDTALAGSRLTTERIIIFEHALGRLSQKGG